MVFDENSPLTCKGIIGDGCGGGRIFYIKKDALFAYDEVSRESLLLAEGFGDAVSLEKKGCIIFLEFADGSVEEFDLSKLGS